jgi:hypothetical protein
MHLKVLVALVVLGVKNKDVKVFIKVAVVVDRLSPCLLQPLLVGKVFMAAAVVVQWGQPQAALVEQVVLQVQAVLEGLMQQMVRLGLNLLEGAVGRGAPQQLQVQVVMAVLQLQYLMGPKMIFAIINGQTNIVTNTVVLEDGAQWTPPSGDYIVNITDTEVGINWVYNPITKQWTPPATLESNLSTDQTGSQPDVIT